MERMERFTFNILGQKMDISIKKEDHNDVVAIVKFYRKKVQELEELYPRKSSLEIAILAGVKVTDEYYSYYKESVEPKKKENYNINKMLDDLGKELDLVIKS